MYIDLRNWHYFQEMRLSRKFELFGWAWRQLLMVVRIAAGKDRLWTSVS